MNKRIRELRKELGLNKEKFGEHLGVETDVKMRLEIKDINDKEWQALDFLLEDVERGNLSEKYLLKDETFLHMLSAVKFNADNFMEVPPFISGSKLCKKYCQQVNPNVIEIINGNKLSKIEVYNKYLEFDVNEERLHLEYGLKEEWLRTDEGSMFRGKSQREKAAYIVGKVLKNDDEFRQKVFIALGEILLEDGEEPAFHGMSQREKAAYMAGKILKTDDEYWHKVIIDLGEMPDPEWDLIQKVVEKLK